MNVGVSKRSPCRTIFVAGVSKNAVAATVAQLNPDRRYRVLYEPFNQWYFGCLWGQRYPAYLPRGGARPEVDALSDRIIGGQIRRAEIDRAVDNQGVAENAEGLLIRECRCNLWLDYFATRYPDMPIVLVWRHPCATIASRLLLDWTPQLRRQLVLKDIIRDHLQPFMKEISQARGPLEQHAFMWAIHHYVPLQQFAKDNIHFVFYEGLVANSSVAEGLCNYVKRPRPEMPAIDPSLRQEKLAVLDTWRQQLSAAQVQRIMEILHIFGLDKIYSTETHPNEIAAYEMLQSA